MLPNALLLCLFKMKFLKSLKPQNAASSFFDFDVVQKAKIVWIPLMIPAPVCQLDFPMG